MRWMRILLESDSAMTFSRCLVVAVEQRCCERYIEVMDTQSSSQPGLLASIATLRAALAKTYEQCHEAADYSGANPSILKSVRHVLYSGLLHTVRDAPHVLPGLDKMTQQDVPLEWTLHQQQELAAPSGSERCGCIFRQGQGVYACR